eukprot:TRINITY_DN4795_c0_g2_i1.p1 TRINITY_DN4795_c0_g2~~TRINITY_DN4795_c0_g2_i1.p1  ORF type:complete len:610 (+),score=126.57 TRINITY_DN4795_c0_g2_i1:191-2020(+)
MKIAQLKYLIPKARSISLKGDGKINTKTSFSFLMNVGQLRDNEINAFLPDVLKKVGLKDNDSLCFKRKEIRSSMILIRTSRHLPQVILYPPMIKLANSRKNLEFRENLETKCDFCSMGGHVSSFCCFKRFPKKMWRNLKEMESLKFNAKEYNTYMSIRLKLKETIGWRLSKAEYEFQCKKKGKGGKKKKHSNRKTIHKGNQDDLPKSGTPHQENDSSNMDIDEPDLNSPPLDNDFLNNIPDDPLLKTHTPPEDSDLLNNNADDTPLETHTPRQDMSYTTELNGTLQNDYMNEDSTLSSSSAPNEYENEYSSSEVITPCEKEKISESSSTEDSQNRKRPQKMFHIPERDSVTGRSKNFFKKRKSVPNLIIDASDLLNPQAFDCLSSDLSEHQNLGKNQKRSRESYNSYSENKKKKAKKVNGDNSKSSDSPIKNNTYLSLDLDKDKNTETPSSEDTFSEEIGRMQTISLDNKIISDPKKLPSDITISKKPTQKEGEKKKDRLKWNDLQRTKLLELVHNNNKNMSKADKKIFWTNVVSSMDAAFPDAKEDGFTKNSVSKQYQTIRGLASDYQIMATISDSSNNNLSILEAVRQLNHELKLANASSQPEAGQQ